MFVLPFLIPLSAFFLTLWLSDIFFTLKATKKNRGLEINPIMKFFLGFRRRFLVFFKLAEIGAFFFLVYLISFKDANYAVGTLFVLIAIYSLVVSSGIYTYLKIGGGYSPVIFVFLAICCIALFFANSTYTIFLDGINYSNSASKCLQDFASLRATCNTTQSSIETGSNADPSLNISFNR